MGIENMQEARAFMAFLLTERNRHYRDIDHINACLLRLVDRFEIPERDIKPAEWIGPEDI